MYALVSEIDGEVIYPRRKSDCVELRRGGFRVRNRVSSSLVVLGARHSLASRTNSGFAWLTEENARPQEDVLYMPKLKLRSLIFLKAELGASVRQQSMMGSLVGTILDVRGLDMTKQGSHQAHYFFEDRTDNDVMKLGMIIRSHYMHQHC